MKLCPHQVKSHVVEWSNHIPNVRSKRHHWQEERFRLEKTAVKISSKARGAINRPTGGKNGQRTNAHQLQRKVSRRATSEIQKLLGKGKGGERKEKSVDPKVERPQSEVPVLGSVSVSGTLSSKEW